MDKLFITKKKLNYESEPKCTVTFNFETRKMLQHKVSTEITTASFDLYGKKKSEWAEISFDDIVGLVILGAVYLLGYDLKCYFKLAVVDTNKLWYLVDEDGELSALREEGKKLAKLLGVPLKTSFDFEESTHVDISGAIKSEYLGLPYAVMLNHAKYFVEENVFEEFTRFYDRRRLRGERRFVDNTPTYFINYVQPLLFVNGNISMIYMIICFSLFFIFLILGFFLEMPTLIFGSADRGLGMPLFGLIIFVFVAIVTRLLFSRVLSERVELVINDREVTYLSSSVLGTRRFAMPTVMLEDVVMAERSYFDAFNNDSMRYCKFENMYFVGKQDTFSINISKPLAEPLANMVKEAFMRVGEKIILDYEAMKDVKEHEGDFEEDS
jgi:hypothetical protein